LVESFDVLHHKSARFDPLYNVEEMKDVPGALVVRIHLSGNTESLAWRATDHKISHVSRRQLLRPNSEKVANMNGMTFSGQVGMRCRELLKCQFMGLHSERIKLIHPERNETGQHKANIKTTGTGI